MKKEPKFIPKPGQIDYTHIKRAPVINCIVQCGDEILLVKRSAGLRLYPNCWNGISGFLDMKGQSVAEKAREELREEAGILPKDIIALEEGRIIEQADSAYDKIWIIHPVLATVKTKEIKLDFEAEDFRWMLPEKVKDYQTVPGFPEVFSVFFP